MSKYGLMNVPMKALESDDCAWPVNSPPPGGVFIFCADVCQNGRRYCEKHQALAYQRGRFIASEAA
ncbi:GcrA cell cycle regulator [Phyllobacterium sp. YR620]|nr:GcrA cell cycle regulator [Phyllobacterium sp. YR620]